MAEFRDEDDSLLTNYSRIPQIASDFTDWRYEKMQEVVSFCKKRDLIPPNFFQECLNLDLIKQNDEAKLNPGERKIVEDFKEKYYKENWQTVLMKMMRYKKPMVANAHWLTKESLKMESGSEVFIHVAWLKPGRHTYLVSHNSETIVEAPATSKAVSFFGLGGAAAKKKQTTFYVHEMLATFREEKIPYCKYLSFNLTKRHFV